LAGENHRSVIGPNRDRLVAVGMPRGWNDENVRQDLCLTIELVVVGAAEVDEMRQLVVRSRAILLQFARLNEDRTADERRVAAAMIEVQVTVGHPAHV